MTEFEIISFIRSKPLLEALNIGILAILIALIFHFVLFRILKLIDKKSDAELWDAILAKGFQPTRYLFVVVMVFLSSNFMDLNQELSGVLNQALQIALVFTIAWVLVRSVNIARVAMLSNYNVDVRNNLHARKVHTQFKMLGNIVKFLIVVVAIGVGLMTFDSIRQLGLSILASAGIAGIILGFAAQKLIATVLAGLQLAITQPIRLDDVVIVEGEWGRVEEMTLTYVVIAIWDKRRLVVPSTYFIEKSFQNWTRVEADILGSVFLYTDYRFPVEDLRNELDTIVEKSPHWDGKVANVQVTDSKEKTMEMRVLVSAKDSGTAWDLRVEVREKLINFIQLKYPEMLPTSRIIVQGSVNS